MQPRTPHHNCANGPLASFEDIFTSQEQGTNLSIEEETKEIVKIYSKLPDDLRRAIFNLVIGMASR